MWVHVIQDLCICRRGAVYLADCYAGYRAHNKSGQCGSWNPRLLDQGTEDYHTVHKTGEGKEDSLVKVILLRTDVVAAIANFSNASPILGPPMGQYIRWKKCLTSSHSTNIRIYSMQGLSEGIKHTLRCKSCSLQYRYSQFGSSKERFMYYKSQEAWWRCLTLSI